MFVCLTEEISDSKEVGSVISKNGKYSKAPENESMARRQAGRFYSSVQSTEGR